MSLRNWALSIVIVLVALFPSALALSHDHYLLALAIWPICLAVGGLSAWLVPPGVATLIFLWRAKHLDKIQTIELDAGSRRELRIAAAMFVGMVSWNVIRAWWMQDTWPVVSILIGVAVQVTGLYLLGRYRYRRHHIGVHGMMVVEPR